MLAILTMLWSYRSLAPWLLCALLGGSTWLEHTRLAESRMETATKTAQLQTAVIANRDDEAAITTLRQGLSQVRAQLAAEQSSAEAASRQAAAQHQALSQSLAVAATNLQNLERDRTYANLLDIDLSSSYPELAASLRKLDATARSQD